MDEDTLSLASELLAAETTMVLSTANADGTPWATPLFYFAEEANLYWLSAPESRHSLNLAVCAFVSAAVFVSTGDWRCIRGVQMQGQAGPASPVDYERILPHYRERFGLGPEFDIDVDRSTLYVLRPDWLRYIDNTRGFGFHLELNLNPR